jgi:hypothetical protein
MRQRARPVRLPRRALPSASTRPTQTSPKPDFPAVRRRLEPTPPQPCLRHRPLHSQARQSQQRPRRACPLELACLWLSFGRLHRHRLHKPSRKKLRVRPQRLAATGPTGKVLAGTTERPRNPIMTHEKTNRHHRLESPHNPRPSALLRPPFPTPYRPRKRKRAAPTQRFKSPRNPRTSSLLGRPFPTPHRPRPSKRVPPPQVPVKSPGVSGSDTSMSVSTPLKPGQAPECLRVSGRWIIRSEDIERLKNLDRELSFSSDTWRTQKNVRVRSRHHSHSACSTVSSARSRDASPPKSRSMARRWLLASLSGGEGANGHLAISCPTWGPHGLDPFLLGWSRSCRHEIDG